MKCPKCEGTTSCLAGESAHSSNWYCDDETCGWNAWTTPQQKIITTEMQLTEAVDKIAKLKELLVEVAGIAHHGALLGFKTMPEAQTKICRLTVDYWDRDECSRLQSGAVK